MNKTAIYIAGSFVIGAVAGSVTLDNIWKKRFTREVDAIAHDIRLDYARYYAGEDGKPSIQSLGIQTMSKEEFQAEAEKVVRSLSERTPKPPVDYTTKFTGGSEDHPVMDLGAAQSLIEKASAQSDAIKDAMGDQPEVETHNVFDESLILPPDFDSRKPGGRYLLTTEEFMEEPKADGYSTITLTWFEYDNTLILETTESIISIEDTIGDGVLAHFGWSGKGDGDTIFVRNEKSKIDFEITRDERSYAEVIMGIPEEDEKPRRKRPEDD